MRATRTVIALAGSLALVAGAALAAPFQEEPVTERKRTGGYLGLFLEERDGVITIASVRPGSGAAAAGFQAGDVVARVNGRPVEHGDQFVQILWSRRPMQVTVRRGDGETTIATSTPELDARPAVGDAAPDFTLPTRDGTGTLGLATACATGRPVVLVFGSFT